MLPEVTRASTRQSQLLYRNSFWAREHAGFLLSLEANPPACPGRATNGEGGKVRAILAMRRG